MTEPAGAAARVPDLHVFRLGEWSVRQSEGVVCSEDRAVRLEPRVMDVLACLAADSGRVVAKEELLARVWGGAFVEEGVLSQANPQPSQSIGRRRTSTALRADHPQEGVPAPRTR
jgi:DNA-binding response OmpR family regulator